MATQHLTPEAVKNSRTMLVTLEAEIGNAVRAASIANTLVENGIVAASELPDGDAQIPAGFVVVLLTEDQADDIIYAVSEAHLRAAHSMSVFLDTLNTISAAQKAST